MTVNLINSSIISSIAAIDFSKSLRSDIYLKSGELLDFNRYFSINEFSKTYLDKLGIWNLLNKEKYVAYASIDVYLKKEKSIDFYSDNPCSHNLGYIVYEGDLLDAISKCISRCKNIKLYDNKIFDNTTDINIHTKIDELEKNDILFKFKNKNYDQTAMNITFEHTKSNSRKPRQIFFDNEILGLLPVNEYTYNLIWSMPNNFYDQTNKASSNSFLKYLSDRVSFFLGDIKKANIHRSFPLSARHATSYFSDNNLLIGDAAHKFHPLAGLGLNMGIEDIATLSNLLSKSNNLRSTLCNFTIKRMSRIQSLQKLLDLIVVFHSSDILSAKLKLKILNYFNKTSYLKPKIIENATGLNNKDLISL
ncbi:MAG: FAD-dependent monooxygenase [Pseudomonadota bacterium]|nr:FAD-dependent monooxygenase [Pseudomonadota bacterium]